MSDVNEQVVFLIVLNIVIEGLVSQNVVNPVLLKTFLHERRQAHMDNPRQNSADIVSLLDQALLPLQDVKRAQLRPLVNMKDDTSKQ